MSPLPLVFLSFLLLIFPLCVRSIPVREPHLDAQKAPGESPSPWYHPEDHPVHNLFKRAPTGDGIAYASVGSAAWGQGFPNSYNVPDPTQMPQAWIDAYNAAMAAGTIPNIPQSTNTQGNNPTYPGGLNPSGPQVCSSTYKCRMPDDIWDAPAGVLGIGFDDGPYPLSERLYTFLQSQNQHATHFMIGINILTYPNAFTMAFDTLGDDIACHTWTHPYMTTLSNLQVVAELGWTMELIHNSTGGRVPMFWRPPYGDADNRVRAIAKEVFGLTMIVWNQDSADWTATSPAPVPGIENNMRQWLNGPKSPGLIILEHEISDEEIDIFIASYPLMVSNGWKPVSVAQLATGTAWQNANGTGPVTPADILSVYPTTTTTSATTTPQPAVDPTAVSTLSKPSATSTNAAFTTRNSPWPLLRPMLLALGLSAIYSSLNIAI